MIDWYLTILGIAVLAFLIAAIQKGIYLHRQNVSIKESNGVGSKTKIIENFITSQRDIFGSFEHIYVSNTVNQAMDHVNVAEIQQIKFLMDADSKISRYFIINHSGKTILVVKGAPSKSSSRNYEVDTDNNYEPSNMEYAF